MKINYSNIFSFFVYGLGLLFFLLAELYIGSNYSQNDIATWAFTKSSVFIIGTVCLLGIDQVFIRDVSLIFRVLKSFILKALLIIIIFLIIVSLFKKEISINDLIVLGLSILIFSVLNYFYSSSRASFHYLDSQISSNLWKILFFIFLIYLGVKSELVLLFSLITGLIISILFTRFKNYKKSFSENRINFIEARKLGYVFLISNLTLTFAIFGEQLLINLFNDTTASAHLFKYFSVFTPIALSVNGFIGFYFGPIVRKQKNISNARYLNFVFKLLIFSIFMTFVSVIFGVFYMKFINNIDFYELDTALILILSLICVIRGVYVSASVYMGAFSNFEHLKKNALFSWLSTFLYIISIILILNYFEGIIVASFIAFASMLNWIFRLLILNNYTFATISQINLKNTKC